MSFDSIAPAYRTLETIAFGGDLQRARIACLGEIETPRRALIVGEGNGRFLCELLRVHPTVEVDCVDASERMLELARQRVEREVPARANQIDFVSQDISAWSPKGHQFDLIVTHFFLDCFSETRISEIVAKLSRNADVNAIWLLADFCVPAREAARLRAGLWLSAMYRFFRITAGIEATELADPSPFLREAGFALASHHLFRSGMVKSERWRRTS
ncbi:MAG: class I SAM-dependent methyltransferase [Verrucomicrobiota bacterium]|nr:class I SAM-dependent methyltransferase [Verrucomicrobiota bacterium]